MRDVRKSLTNMVLYTPLFSPPELIRCKKSVERYKVGQTP